MLDPFGENGTYSLTDGSTYFTGSSSNEIIISDALAYQNNLVIGDTVSLETYDLDTMDFVIIGTFLDSSTIIDIRKNTSDNEVFIPLNDALILKGQDPDSSFTITSVKYYLDDPLNINTFISESSISTI